MNKRVITLSILVALILGLPIFLYFYFSPKANNAPDVIHHVSETISYETFENTVIKEQGRHVVFLNNEDDDATYIKETIVARLVDTDKDALPKVHCVSVKEERDLTVTQLKSKYHIERTPAFIYLEVNEDKKVTILDTLTFYHDNPFTSDMLKTWLYDNGLWDGPYGN